MKSKASAPKDAPLSISAEAKELSNLISGLHNIFNSKEELYAEAFNLTLSEVKLLRMFGDSPSLKVADICSKVHITNGRISHIIASLEGKGYIKRTMNPEDRRSVTITLTNKSQAFFNNITACYINLHKKVLAKAGKEKRNLLLELMKLVNDTFANCE